MFNGIRKRIYGSLVSTFEGDHREEIFEKWIERDEEREQKKLGELEAKTGVTVNQVSQKSNFDFYDRRLSLAEPHHKNFFKNQTA